MNNLHAIIQQQENYLKVLCKLLPTDCFRYQQTLTCKKYGEDKRVALVLILFLGKCPKSQFHLRTVIGYSHLKQSPQGSKICSQKINLYHPSLQFNIKDYQVSVP